MYFKQLSRNEKIFVFLACFHCLIIALSNFSQNQFIMMIFRFQVVSQKRCWRQVKGGASSCSQHYVSFFLLAYVVYVSSLKKGNWRIWHSKELDHGNMCSFQKHQLTDNANVYSMRGKHLFSSRTWLLTSQLVNTVFDDICK